jgi:PAS domain S-box-containing protein
LRDAVGVPVIVVSQHDDNLAAINGALREVGHAVHCVRVAEAAALEEVMAAAPPELVLIFADEPQLDLSGLSGTAFRRNPPIPVVLVRQNITEKTIAEGLAAGARDVVSLAQRSRLQAVVERELRIHRLQATLSAVLSSASQYQHELRSLMQGATEAIADVQEGITVAANPAWLNLFGLQDEQELLGQPFMDLFIEQDKVGLKGALQACLKGRWADDALKVTVERRDQRRFAIDLRLERVTVDAEPAVRVVVPIERITDAPPEELVEQAPCNDPSTGF